MTSHDLRLINRRDGMKRESINPWDWDLKWNMDQGEVISGASRHLHYSRQVAVRPGTGSELGLAVVSPTDIRGHMEQPLGNVYAVLAKACMARKSIINLPFFTTDIEGFLANCDVCFDWIAIAGTRPLQSLLGVQRLFLQEPMVEIEAVAAG